MVKSGPKICSDDSRTKLARPWTVDEYPLGVRRLASVVLLPLREGVCLINLILKKIFKALNQLKNESVMLDPRLFIRPRSSETIDTVDLIKILRRKSAR